MGQIMKTTVLMILMLCTFGVANGQHKKRPPFNPAKFEADLEQFITVNACLSPSQAASFFPVYRQMMKKQRALFDEMRRLRMINPKDNEACEEAIRKQDELDIQIKQLQQEYHGRFLMMLPANKSASISWSNTTASSRPLPRRTCGRCGRAKRACAANWTC